LTEDGDGHRGDIVRDGKDEILAREPPGMARNGGGLGHSEKAIVQRDEIGILRPTSAAVAGAMDAWATARAGASFRPSPTINTR